jgi:hypothetical protein
MKQKSIKNKIFWARLSYWTGAIVDLIIGIAAIFFPGFTQYLWQLDIPIQGADLMWTKYFGSIVFAWTCLLLWADRKPLERKGVLLLTCFPVLVGLIAVEVYAMIQNIAPMLNLGLLIGMQTILLILFGFSYINSREIE